MTTAQVGLRSRAACAKVVPWRAGRAARGRKRGRQPSAMSWITHHRVSERLASEAQAASFQGQCAEAIELYAQAADAEEKALRVLDPSKTRTIGISAVSAASLYYKAAKLARAKEVADQWLDFATLPEFARQQLRGLLQSIWTEKKQPMEVAEERGEYSVGKAPGGKESAP